MARAERDFKVILTLTEEEAREVYLNMRSNVWPNHCKEVREAISKVLGYTPQDDGDGYF